MIYKRSIKYKVDIDIINIIFRDPETGDRVERDNIPDFLKLFFANIAERTRGPDSDIDRHVPDNMYSDELPGFDFAPVATETVLACGDDIDVNMSSCIDGINMKTCKILVKNFLEKLANLFTNSLYTGIFPKEWTCSMVTL